MSSVNDDLGKLRLTADLRQMGGLLLLFSLAVTIFPQAGIASAVGPGAPNSGMALSGFIGGVCVMAVGFLGLCVGWWTTTFDGGHKYMTLLLGCSIQLGYIPWVTGERRSEIFNRC